MVVMIMTIMCNMFTIANNKNNSDLNRIQSYNHYAGAQVDNP